MDKFSRVTKDEIIHNLENLKQLVFEVTDACNLSCQYCGYSDLYEGFDKRESHKFSLHKAKLIIDYLYNFWVKNQRNGNTRCVVISFYGGEPLLNMSFIREVIGYVESLPFVGRRFEYSMTTNATLLDRYMDFLVSKNFQLLISLDGDEYGHSYRTNNQGQNSFHQVYRNIQLLREKHLDYFEKKVYFNSVIHNRNCIGSAYSFIKEEFGKKSRFVAITSYRLKKNSQTTFAQMYRSVSDSIDQSDNKEILEKELFVNEPRTEQVIDYIYKHSGNVLGTYSELLINREHLAFHPTGTCSPFSRKMFVTVNGRILACERIDHTFTFGVVTHQKVEMDIEQVAEEHNNNIFRYVDQCYSCAMNKSCQQCVYQVDNTNEAQIKCRLYVTEKDRKNQVMSIISYLDKHPGLYNRLLNEVTLRG